MAAQAPFEQKLVVLIAMSVVMTVGIYGLIAALVRLDDMGLALIRAPDAARQAIGRRIVWAAPRILGALGPIGMVAMLAVAGGIFTHLVHFQAPHRTLGMAVDIVTGSVVGVMLAAAGAWVQRLVAPKASGGRRRPASRREFLAVEISVQTQI